MYNLTDRFIVLGVTGSIAAYKAADLASKLTQAGAHVDVVMTEAATRFVAPLTFHSLTGRPALVDMFDIESGAAEVHVELGRRADLVVVAPATATTIARLAQGLAEDMVSLAVLATKAPVVLCPAMDSQMWEHEVTQANVETLRRRGVHFVGPEVGRLASGHLGVGRLAEPETIMGAIRYVVGRRGDLAGRKLVVSAGGTQEPIDPVRYIGNYSSGKMGYAVAEAGRDRGAAVALVTAPTALADPYGVKVMRVGRAEEMCDAIVSECRDADILVMAAAVADYQPAAMAGQKIKRSGRGMTLELTPTPDILAAVGQRDGLVRVGFAAESEDVAANARQKLKAKGLDLIAANDVTAADSGFSADTNRVILLDREGGEEELPLMSKYEVAWQILDRVAALLRGTP